MKSKEEIKIKLQKLEFEKEFQKKLFLKTLESCHKEVMDIIDQEIALLNWVLE